MRKYTRNFLTTCAQIEVYEVLRWGGQSAHIQILVNDNIGNRVCTDTGREDLAFFWLNILQCIKQNMGSLSLFHPIHAKSGRYLRYISAKFFGFSAKILGRECEINTAPKPSPEVAPSKMEVAPY